MGSITIILVSILGIVCGLLLAGGIVYLHIVKSNTRGEDQGDIDDFKKVGSEHFFAKEKAFRNFNDFFEI